MTFACAAAANMRRSETQVWKVRDTINWWSVAMGVGSMLVYFALRRGNAYIKARGVGGFFVPEALSVVILSTFLSWAREKIFALQEEIGA